MALTFELANVKCGGCGNTIRKAMTAFPEVGEVTLDVEHGVLTVEADPAQRQAMATRLRQLGYPEKGTIEGMAAVAAEAKSFVSCAIGRLDHAGDD